MTNRKQIQMTPTGLGLILSGMLAVLVAVFYQDFFRSVRDPELLISEIMAVNQSTLTDADGDYSDWIEIYNPKAYAQNLKGWFLTDDFRNLKQWMFPELELAPGGFVIVFASGKNRTNRLDDLHANFSLSQKGEYLALIKPAGKTVVNEYLPKYPRMDADVSFGLRANQFAASNRTNGNQGFRKHAFFASPTPGRANQSEMLGRVADTKFSHHRGIYTAPFDLTITSSTPGAEIRFTTDGSTPAPGIGTRYEAPIPIRGNTVLRAAAFKEGFKATDVDTLTYIFPGKLPQQTGDGFPETWGVRNESPVIADYEMDPEIGKDPKYRQRLIRSFTAIPTLSVVMDRAELFDPKNGIYSNPLETGSEWERMASVELIHPDGARGFHVHCGVRIQGGWSRRPEESPKHSLRLEFKQRYGLSHLNHPLFGEGGLGKFKTLILRAGSNNSWLHWSSTERRRGDLVRDQFMRDSLRDVGELSSRGAFFHLYLNGLYWGIYNASERPDQSFLAGHLGGTQEDFESRNGSNVLMGDEQVWNRIFELANAGLEDSGRYDELKNLVNVERFSDFMLVQIYGGTSDWDASSNWYAGRRIKPSRKYQFFIWDSERSLEEINANILGVDDDRSPTRLFQALRKNTQFQATFRSIAARHLGTAGALSPELTRQRFEKLAEMLRPAIVAESARWGDYRRDVHPYKEGPYELYTVDDHWQPEIDRLLKRYFPARTAEVIKQLKEAGLY